MCALRYGVFPEQQIAIENETVEIEPLDAVEKFEFEKNLTLANKRG